MRWEPEQLTALQPCRARAPSQYEEMQKTNAAGNDAEADNVQVQGVTALSR